MKRILLTLAATAGFFMLLLAEEAQATPIRPDLQKLMSQPQEAAIQFVPARAGWQGPEMSPAPEKPAPAGGLLDDSASARAMRDTLIAVAVPDARLIVLVALAIFLLRRLRRPRVPQAVHQEIPQVVTPNHPAKAA